MFWLNFFAKLIKLIKEGATPAQLAGGFSLGFFIGLTPGWPLHILVTLFLLLIFRLNLSMATLGATLAVALSWLLDPLIEPLGGWMLQDVAALKTLWTLMYNNPLMMLTHFNNTVVMGSFILGFALLLPLYFSISWFITKYREKLAAVMEGWFNKLLKITRLHKLYQRASKAGLL